MFSFYNHWKKELVYHKLIKHSLFNDLLLLSANSQHNFLA